MKTHYHKLSGGTGFWTLLAVLGGIIAIALGASYYMEHNGHWVTGMSNQVVWGMPHVFAIFLIVAASGALNVASIGTVFGQKMYKPLGRFSGLLAIALLLGGLIVLVLDLGRPDRLIVAMTTYNPKSIFAWNILLYNGFIALTAVYLWFMMERKMNRFYPIAGLAAFIWRLVLTTGTGSIFGFLVAREAYDSAIMAPLFIVLSFSAGLAMFILVSMLAYHWSNRPLGDALLFRLKKLLGIFVASTLYFLIAFHVTALYATEHHGFERFLLLDGGGYTQLFWVGYVILGSLLPLSLIYMPGTANNRMAVALSSALVVLGAFSLLYVIIIGGQAYPLNIFPGYEVSSSFYDGVVAEYSPSLPEILLGIGGVAIAMAIVAVAAKALDFLPATLADEQLQD